MRVSLVTQAFAITSAITPALLSNSHSLSLSADPVPIFITLGWANKMLICVFFSWSHNCWRWENFLCFDVFTHSSRSFSVTATAGPILPGRVELSLCLCSQRAVLIQERPRSHRPCSQAGQQHRSVAAGDQTPEGAWHLSSRSLPQVSVKRRRARNKEKKPD